MKDINLLIILILISLFVYFVYKNIYKNQENLNSDEEQKKIEITKPASDNFLGVYYTEWCGYSRDFLQQLESGLQKKIENEGISVNLVDCDKNKEMCQKLQIEGFPTVLLHKNDKIIQYNGNRTDDDLINFVKSN
jgi:thiol-disulfide isomerase/thioredoxin